LKDTDRITLITSATIIKKPYYLISLIVIDE